jgi:hypothetical protein
LFILGEWALDIRRKHSEEWLDSRSDDLGGLISRLGQFQQDSDTRRKSAEDDLISQVTKSDARRKTAEDNLNTQSVQLEALVRELKTLPPADFLSDLGSTFRKCRQIRATVDENPGAIDKSRVQRRYESYCRTWPHLRVNSTQRLRRSTTLPILCGSDPRIVYLPTSSAE